MTKALSKVIATSKKFEVNGLDIKSVGRTGLDGSVALITTILPMFVLPGVTYHIGHFDATPFVLILETMAVKFVRKWATDHSSALN